MSNLYRRLHGLFSTTQNAANSMKLKLPPIHNPRPINGTKFVTSDSIPAINRGIKELFDEKDSKKLAEKFNSLSKYRYFRQKHRIYDCIIHRLALAKQSSLIEETLEFQKNYIVGEGFAARLIYLYGKAGMFEHAHNLFDELPQRNCARSSKSFNALLGAASNAGKFDKVYELFREMPPKLMIKPDTNCYNTAAHALCKIGLLNDAVSLLDEMEENGLEPCVVSFNTFLGALYGKGEFEEGEKIWERMIKSGVQPDTFSYNFKLHGLANDGKMSEALELVMELKEKGLNPDVGTYNALILGSCKTDDLDGVNKWYGELLSHGCMPNRVTFSTIIPFLCDKGDFSLAFEVCKRKFKHQCSVDESLLQRVVDGLAKNSMITEAEVLVGLGKCNSYYPYSLALPSRSYSIFS